MFARHPLEILEVFCYDFNSSDHASLSVGGSSGPEAIGVELGHSDNHHDFVMEKVRGENDALVAAGYHGQWAVYRYQDGVRLGIVAERKDVYKICQEGKRHVFMLIWDSKIPNEGPPATRGRGFAPEIKK